MERKRIGKWVLSVLLWFWTGGVYFFGEVIWKTSQGRPETISWTMFTLAIILAVPLERFGAELPWGMPLVGQACICAAAITALEFVTGLVLNVWLGLGLLALGREHPGTNLPAVYFAVARPIRCGYCHTGLDEVCGRGWREAPLHITE